MGVVDQLLARFASERPSPALVELRAAQGPVAASRRDLRSPQGLEAAALEAGFKDIAFHRSSVRQRLWGITNFLDVCLSYPLAHAEHEEMEPDAKDLFVTVAQELLAGRMDLEEFIATADLVHMTAVRPGRPG
jgi:hypothetical protein